MAKNRNQSQNQKKDTQNQAGKDIDDAIDGLKQVLTDIREKNMDETAEQALRRRQQERREDANPLQKKNPPKRSDDE